MKNLKLIAALVAIAAMMYAWVQYAQSDMDLRIGTALRAERNGRV